MRMWTIVIGAIALLGLGLGRPAGAEEASLRRGLAPALGARASRDGAQQVPAPRAATAAACAVAAEGPQQHHQCARGQEVGSPDGHADRITQSNHEQVPEG